MEFEEKIVKKLSKGFRSFFDYYQTDENSGCSNRMTNKHIDTIVESLVLPFSKNAMTDMYILPEWDSKSFLEYYRGDWDYVDKSRKDAGLEFISKLNEIIENRYYNIELDLESLISGNVYDEDILSYLQHSILSKMYEVLELEYSKVKSNN